MKYDAVRRESSHLFRPRFLSYKSSGSLSWATTTIIVAGIFVMLLPIYNVIAPLYASLYQFNDDFIGTTSSIGVVPYIVLISIFLYRQQKRASISDYFIILLTLFYYLPGNVMYVYGNWSERYFVFHFLSYAALVVTNELMPNFTLKVSSPPAKYSKNTVSALPIFISLSVILITLYYNGLRINLNLDEVYDLRNEWRASGMPNIFNYYIPFTARITPVLLLITLKQHRFWPSLLLIFSQLVSFSFGGMKYTLFALILAILFHFFGQKIDAKKIIIYFAGFVCLCMVECFLITDQIPMISAYTLRRMSFIPNQIGSYFFSFTQSHDYLYYSESFLSVFGHYPYHDGFPHVIGEYAFGRPNMAANTGLFAEGFSQIGWLSLPIYAFLYVLVFRIYDACSRGFRDTELSHVPLLGVLLYAFTLQDCAFFTALLTQGLALSIFTIYLLSRSNFTTRRYKQY